MKFSFRKKQEPSGNFRDGLTSLTNDLINQRKASATNKFTTEKLADQELRAIFQTGVFSKIVRIKTGYALRDPFDFEDDKQEEFFKEKLSRAVKQACQYQLGFGRGLIVFIEGRSDDLAEPKTGTYNPETTDFRVFDGSMVSVTDYSQDLLNPRYYKPIMYNVRGENIHYTRCVDFTYYMPVEEEQPNYNFAGVSEAQLIYEQLTNDAVVQRGSGSMIERLSTVYYKVAGFKSDLQNKQEGNVLRFFGKLSQMASFYGSGVVDKEDDIQTVTQALTGFKDLDESSLRRLTMVTGIPMPMFVGEAVKGLNSSGDTERQTFNDTINSYRGDYIIDNVNEMFEMFGMECVKCKESANLTPTEKVNYESSVLDNAQKFAAVGGDAVAYLEDKGLMAADRFEELFKEPEEEEPENGEADNLEE